MPRKNIAIDLDVYRALESSRIDFQEDHNAILRRLVLSAPKPNTDTAKKRKVAASVSLGQRTTGNWTVVIKDAIYAPRNLKEAYVTALIALEEFQPGLLSSLSNAVASSRRMVARKPEQLYTKSPHLAEPGRNNFYAHNGWYIDHNLSQDQAAQRIRKATAEAGLIYGQDVAIKKELELI